MKRQIETIFELHAKPCKTMANQMRLEILDASRKMHWCIYKVIMSRALPGAIERMKGLRSGQAALDFCNKMGSLTPREEV